MSATTVEGEGVTDEKLQPIIWGNQLGTGIFFKDISLGENKSVLAALDLSHLVVTRCLFPAKLWSSQMQLQPQ